MVDGTQKRAAGKAAKRAMIVWQLEAGRLRLRCVEIAPATFVVEASGGGAPWQALGSGSDSRKLLRRASNSKAVGDELR